MTLPQTPSFALNVKRALVAGASSGIGLACAAALGQAGAPHAQNLGCSRNITVCDAQGASNGLALDAFLQFGKRYTLIEDM